MKFEEAQKELRRCLHESKTISTVKAKKLMNDLNIRFSGYSKEEDSPQVTYLKGEIKKLKKRNKQLKKQNGPSGQTKRKRSKTQ